MLTGASILGMAVNGDDKKNIIIVIIITAGKVRLPETGKCSWTSSRYVSARTQGPEITWCKLKHRLEHSSKLWLMGCSSEGGWMAQRPHPDPQHISWLSFLGISCKTHVFPKALDGEDLGQNKESESKSGTNTVGAIPKPPDGLEFFMLNTSRGQVVGSRKSSPCLANTKWQGGSRPKKISYLPVEGPIPSVFLSASGFAILLSSSPAQSKQNCVEWVGWYGSPHTSSAANCWDCMELAGCRRFN